MKFLNRKEEKRRLEQTMNSTEGELVVLWGRRRVGKTRLLIEWANNFDGLYWVATQTSSVVHRSELAEVLGQKIVGFEEATYSTWDQLFKRLSREVAQGTWKGPLVLDEFPYMVESASELPSVLQRYIDHDFKKAGLKVAIAGSSQRMMQGLVLDGNAPLYGRARELMKIEPILAGYIQEALKIKDPRKAVEAYSVWGGIPRYWELAEQYGDDVEAAVMDLALDSLGALHQEPKRLLLEEGTSLLALKPVLDTIGAGVHRVSEMAGRLGQPASGLTYALGRLQEMDIVEREIPYGNVEKSGKRALYKIKDPFFRFWFHCIGSKLSILLQSDRLVRQEILNRALPKIVSESWEELCRKALPRLMLKYTKGKDVFMPAGRYWSKGEAEWDMISQTMKKDHAIIGEAKWTKKEPTEKFLNETMSSLKRKGMPKIRGFEECSLRYCLFVTTKPTKKLDLGKNSIIFDAKDVMSILKD